MPIKNAIHSQQVYDPTDDSIMAEQKLCKGGSFLQKESHRLC